MKAFSTRRRAGVGLIVGISALLLAACSSAATPAASSTASSAASSPAATTGSAANGSAATGSAATGSAAGGSGASGSVAQMTGGGSGQIDKATYDGVVAAAPKADDATIQANPWAKAIKDRGVLRTGGSETGQLFSLLDLETGKVVGFDAGLSQMLAQYILGQPNTELTVTTVDTRETLLQNGTVDGVFATYSITPARAEKIAFAGPYFVSGDAIAVRQDNTDITSVADLAGKTVTTQTNSTALTALQDQAPTATLQPYTDDAQCQAALTQGRADAYVIDQSILISDAIENAGIKVVGQPFTVDPYGIGVTKDDPSAKQFVDAWLKTIEDDGSWAALWKATIGTVVEGDAPPPPVIGSVPGS
jgi:glutamate transport system substrate-binding protein